MVAHFRGVSFCEAAGELGRHWYLPCLQARPEPFLPMPRACRNIVGAAAPLHTWLAAKGASRVAPQGVPECVSGISLFRPPDTSVLTHKTPAGSAWLVIIEGEAISKAVQNALYAAVGPI